MLESFFKYHDCIIYVIGDEQAAQELKDFEQVFFLYSSDETIRKFSHGHEGTAKAFSEFLKHSGTYSEIVHLDSDIVFKQESLSLIQKEFDGGYDIVGSRRCYHNNPSLIPIRKEIPDAVSTYFFGIKKSVLPDVDTETLEKMIIGHPFGLKHPILDFFDVVTFHALNKGAKIKFLEQEHVGGQNENGKKTSSYKSNLHLDMGSHLVHFGGVGTGYAVYNKLSSPQKDYANWSLGRYELFQKLFYNEQIDCHSPTQYGSDGRWINGSPDENIYNLIKTELEN